MDTTTIKSERRKKVMENIENAEVANEAKEVQETAQMVPKHRFDEVNTKLKEARETLANQSQIAETLKQREEELKLLRQEIDTLRNEYTNKEVSRTKTEAILSKIRGKVIDEDLVLQLIDLGQIKIEGDKVSGIDEQLNNLKKSKSYLWQTKKPVVDLSLRAPIKTEPTFAQQLGKRRKEQQSIIKKSSSYFK